MGGWDGQHLTDSNQHLTGFDLNHTDLCSECNYTTCEEGFQFDGMEGVCIGMATISHFTHQLKHIFIFRHQ